ncbi:MAG: type II toxin-antitoxin system PemK/MazF family toxin [Saprospiraceae bacterium]
MKQYDVWLADLNPVHGTEPGKIRPVLIIQNDHLLRLNHPSTLICPLTSQESKVVGLTRVSVKSTEIGLDKQSTILIDQIRAIDNSRFLKYIGNLPNHLVDQVREGLIQVLNLEE